MQQFIHSFAQTELVKDEAEHKYMDFIWLTVGGRGAVNESGFNGR